MVWFSLFISCCACGIAWWSWCVAEDVRDELGALRYKLRRELGSDGL